MICGPNLIGRSHQGLGCEVAAATFYFYGHSSSGCTSMHAVFVLILAAATSPVRSEDRSIDGTGNNLANPLWGSAASDYSREASGAHFADGISVPVAAGLPSARAVTNA